MKPFKMKKKVCNQYFVSDMHRDRRYKATLKCAWCDEESNFTVLTTTNPDAYIFWMKSFKELHTAKGCNCRALHVQEWADMDITFEP